MHGKCMRRCMANAWRVHGTHGSTRRLAQQLRHALHQLSLLERCRGHHVVAAEPANHSLQLRHRETVQLRRLQFGRRPALAEDLACRAVEHVVELDLKLRLGPSRIAAVAAPVPHLGALGPRLGALG